MLILAIDTCLSACQAAVTDGNRVLVARSEPMARGHQERLAPLVREAMARADARFSALDRVAVTVGPGSFTGLRVGLAFAKGLGFALAKPCIGVGTLEALTESSGGGDPVAAVIDAGRGNLYLQLFDGGAPFTAPDILPIGVAPARVAEVFGARAPRIVGPAAHLLEAVAPGSVLDPLDWPSPEAVARLAAKAPADPPRPLYLRPADAKPKAARQEPAWN